MVGTPEEKRPIGRQRRGWLDNIKIDLKRDRMGCYGLDHLPQDRNSYEQSNEPSGSLKCWEVPE
jgi:hypothetical protein